MISLDKECVAPMAAVRAENFDRNEEMLARLPFLDRLAHSLVYDVDVAWRPFRQLLGR
jgi:hypothetical protein